MTKAFISDVLIKTDGSIKQEFMETDWCYGNLYMNP
jgi:hypothetical protein